ncbi:MAG: pyridoxal kinase [Hyphomonadaceae bacterium]
MKTILSIQSQVAGSLVGNAAACFAMRRLGVRALPIPTTLFGRRPDRGPPGGGPTPPGLMTAMLDALENDGALAEVDIVLSGYFADSTQADVILDAAVRVKAANPHAIYVCDPVMGDSDKGTFVSPEVAGAIQHRLAPAADLLTPNLWELGALANRSTIDIAQTRAAALSLGRPVLVTSAPAPAGIGALYCAGASAWLVETPRAPLSPKGAGDLFTALFLAHRLNGRSVAVALEAAAGGIYDVIVRSGARSDGELAAIEAQDKMVDPDTWPTAQPLGA